MKFSAVILAAGKGVRMVSALPKILHPVAGKPMAAHVIDQVKAAGIDDIVLVTGFGRERVEEAMSGEQIKFVLQEQQLGTGHALMQAAPAVDHQGQMLVLAGDTPLLSAKLLKELMDYHIGQGTAATVLSCIADNPYGYGRIIRAEEGYLERIVEEKDADESQKIINEINSGIYCFETGIVFECLSQLNNNNAQKEYYLTEVIEILRREKKPVAVFMSTDSESVYGINDREQLAFAESVLRRRKNVELMKEGVTILDPLSTFIDSEVKIGSDTVILPFTIIEGKTVIGQNCEIGPGTRINSSLIGNGVKVDSSRINEAEIGDDCNIGPFSYLRPDTVLHNGVKVGDFVEVKKSIIGEKSKIPHLSYVGDAQVGKGVNIGAGTITCNYDGKNKYRTVLEDGVFIGSNTNLVAPVKIGKDSYTGAGSTITKDVGEDSLAVERAVQKNISGWSKRSK
ncbi:MAG: bifunctional UDP-N-acetylglucosamine diphosphorylase/glucosamine-1-phosphate N-acetyltransferase GlmU [Syntrophomonadaceae bacterium]|nr:bifunctional UDP-N-acetylglucosamine diphosphorylase/glucosamine-1-phosphate N-acetyltransferase GlmU [Syntrophomonadaceae bacterium]